MNDVYSVGLDRRDRVNDAIGGGFPSGSIVLIEGEDGAGKSVLTQRFAYGLACEDHPVTYVSTELAVQEFVDQMESLDYPVVDHLLHERLLFLHADVNTYAAGGGEPNRELIARFMAADVPWRADVVVVDTLDALLENDPHFDVATEREEGARAMQALVSWMRERTATGTTIVVTVDPETVVSDVLSPLRDIADVYLDIDVSAVGQEIRRQVRVRRFRGMASPVDDTIGFSVEQGRGITIVNRTIA